MRGVSGDAGMERTGPTDGWTHHAWVEVAWTVVGNGDTVTVACTRSGACTFRHMHHGTPPPFCSLHGKPSKRQCTCEREGVRKLYTHIQQRIRTRAPNLAVNGLSTARWWPAAQQSALVAETADDYCCPDSVAVLPMPRASPTKPLRQAASAGWRRGATNEALQLGAAAEVAAHLAAVEEVTARATPQYSHASGTGTRRLPKLRLTSCASDENGV